ncbi:hypothetical protein SynA15127_02352 [Synechococcus sp. A15-127]|nr:hypothetical protein SynA15127_02352 [Synechococcus sp. A15-127]
MTTNNFFKAAVLNQKESILTAKSQNEQARSESRGKRAAPHVRGQPSLPVQE